MFDAIHKKSGIKYFASTTWEGKFVNPQKELWICPKEKILSEIYEEIDVILKKKHTRILKNNNECFVSSHFYIPNREKRGIILKERNKRHDMCNVLLSNLFQNEKFLIVCGHSNFCKDDLPNIILDESLMERRRSIFSLNEENNRADVLIKFEKHDKMFGKGICFETQLSPMSDEEKNKREESWFRMGYSIGWLYEDKFDFSRNIPFLLINEIEVTPWIVGIDNLHKSGQEKLWEEVVKLTNKVEEVEEYYENNIMMASNKMDNILKIIKEKVNTVVNSEFIDKEMEESISKIKIEINSLKETINQLIDSEMVDKRVDEITSEKIDEAFYDLDLKIDLLKENLEDNLISSLKRKINRCCVNCKYGGSISSVGKYAEPKDICDNFVNCWWKHTNWGKKGPVKKSKLESCDQWIPKNIRGDV